MQNETAVAAVLAAVHDAFRAASAPLMPIVTEPVRVRPRYCPAG